MTNRYFNDEEIQKDGLYHLISLANVLHAENPAEVEDDWISAYHLENGD